MTCPECATGAVERVYVKHGIPLLRCRRCGLGFAADIPVREELERRYADYYSDQNTTISAVTRKRQVEFLGMFEPYRTRNRILDVGCGCGFFVETALGAGWDAYGTEVSRSAERYFRARGLPADQIFVGEVGVAGFEEGSFDVVTMFEVIEHLRDPAGTLAAIRCVLREGGVLYLTTPNFDSLSRYLLGSSWSIILPTEHLFYFTVGPLGRLLRRTGYRIRSSRTTGFNYYEVLHCLRGRDRSSYEALQEGRERIERNAALRTLKQGADRFLSLVRLGDTIKVLAEKPRGARVASVPARQHARSD